MYTHQNRMMESCTPCSVYCCNSSSMFLPCDPHNITQHCHSFPSNNVITQYPFCEEIFPPKVTDGKCNLWTWYTKYKMAESINNLYIQWKQIIPYDILETWQLLLFILQRYIFIKIFIVWNKGTKLQVGTSYLWIEF